MAKQFYKTKDKKKNNKLVNVINNGFSDLKHEIKNMSEDEKEIEKPEKILKVVEEILNFNKQNQIGKGLKILTPNQKFSRLPISLAQVKARNNLKNIKRKLGNYCILCTDQKNLRDNSIKIWLTLFENRNSLYEHWEQ